VEQRVKTCPKVYLVREGGGGGGRPKCTLKEKQGKALDRSRGGNSRVTQAKIFDPTEEGPNKNHGRGMFDRTDAIRRGMDLEKSTSRMPVGKGDV